MQSSSAAAVVLVGVAPVVLVAVLAVLAVVLLLSLSRRHLRLTGALMGGRRRLRRVRVGIV